MATGRRPRPVPGGCLVGVAALFWCGAVVGIPLWLIQHWAEPGRERLHPWFLDAAVALAAGALVGLALWFVGYLFWVPGRRLIGDHTRRLLEERRSDGGA